MAFLAGSSVVLSCAKCGLWGHDQDQFYGRGRRVHNVGVAKSKGEVSVTCTVCGERRTMLADAVKRLASAGLVPVGTGEEV
ncbi:hypothetical protein D6833_02950 [Candidatus Parcubacteria bacterium]|nr:MAG: hypothetical protein D6833_02950 [Candidatus Parcubacteria bacterium]